MEVVLYPNPGLRRRAELLAEVDDSVRDRVREMNPSGEPDPALERVYINPRIRAAEGEVTDEEGCLSIPGVRGKVRRNARLIVSALDIDGRPFEETLDDLAARVVQHENDHLDGILFITRLSTFEKMQASKVLKKLEKEYKERLQVG
jgi:peptide deformylase